METRDLRARKAALLLHGLDAAQRESVMARLGPAHREALDPWLAELAELGIPPSLGRRAGHGKASGACAVLAPEDGVPVQTPASPAAGSPSGPLAETGPAPSRMPKEPWLPQQPHTARESVAPQLPEMPHGPDAPRAAARAASPTAGGLPVQEEGCSAPLPHPRQAARALRDCAAPTAAAVLRDTDAAWRAALLGRLGRPRRRAVARALERDDALPPRAADALRELLREAAAAAAGTAASTAAGRTAVRRWTRWLPWMS